MSDVVAASLGLIVGLVILAIIIIVVVAIVSWSWHYVFGFEEDTAPMPDCIVFSDGTVSVVVTDCKGSWNDVSWLLHKGYHIDAIYSTCSGCKMTDYARVVMTR